jgi:uracil-DNA glycosylase
LKTACDPLSGRWIRYNWTRGGVRKIASSHDFEDLHRRVFTCRKCPNAIPSEVRRSVNPLSIRSSLVLMAQAPAEAGVRKSGRHWVGLDGKLHPPGGPFLDRHLRTIGFTIDPDNTDLPYPCTMNIFNCWTGRASKRDRPPLREELLSCSEWWSEELKLLEPYVIVLLGKPTTESFGSIYGDRRKFTPLLDPRGQAFRMAGLELHRFVLPHPTAPLPQQVEPVCKCV